MTIRCRPSSALEPSMISLAEAYFIYLRLQAIASPVEADGNFVLDMSVFRGTHGQSETRVDYRQPLALSWLNSLEPQPVGGACKEYEKGFYFGEFQNSDRHG